jgi:hypothetical protein
MKILAVSDKVDELLYSPAIKHLFKDVDLVLGCGDLPFHYLEFLVTMLGKPLFYVVGNHANEIRKRHEMRHLWQYPGGCENIDGRVVRHRKLLVAGLEGSMRYNQSPNFQYTDGQKDVGAGARPGNEQVTARPLPGHPGHPRAAAGDPRQA